MNCRLILSVVGFGIAASVPALAVTLVPLADAELASASVRMVVVTVTQVTESIEDPDGDGVAQPWTTVTARVESAVKGADGAGDLLVFRQMGGKVGGRTLRIPGMPVFAAGDRALLCLGERLMDPKYTPLVGWAQGRWIVRAGDDGEDLACRDYADSCFAAVVNGKLLPADRPETPEEKLSDVIARLTPQEVR
ncbi:MAG: hypothetical protein FD180_2256 [Planctomycetota bacterium]|nr:MAG: hypothetical protein FD180_2256 [Planctomycetota bacterium]